MANDNAKRARARSLEDLMHAMDEDDAGQIPGIHEKSEDDDAGNPGPGGHPILRIEIDGVGDQDKSEDVTPSDEFLPSQPLGGQPSGEKDPEFDNDFESLLRRKLSSRK